MNPILYGDGADGATNASDSTRPEGASMSHTPVPQIMSIIKALLFDLTDRRGFDTAWDDMDDDVRIEIKDALGRILESHPQVARWKVADRIVSKIEEGLRIAESAGVAVRTDPLLLAELAAYRALRTPNTGDST
jgi:hypothetical protein